MMLMRAGALTIYYDQGFLYHIHYGKTEILKRIFFALRDENWETAPLLIENEKVEKNEKSFRVSYKGRHLENELPVFEWIALICGNEDGVITFEINGIALTGFNRNRLGFCVLHPVTEGYSPVEVTHSDGMCNETEFPEYIAAYTPFQDVKKIKWRNQLDWFSLLFEGDIFETEDQRNWSDASFKTYCTPLALTFPVKLEKGDTVNQKIIFSPEAVLVNDLVRAKGTVEIKLQEQMYTIPKIGIGASSETDRLSARDAELIGKLALDHYRIDVDLTTEYWEEKLYLDHEHAKILNLPLQIVLYCEGNFEQEWTWFQDLCLRFKLSVKEIILLSKNDFVTQQALAPAIADLRVQLPGVLIGAGTDYNFTEINRYHKHSPDADFICFPIQPQEHDADDFTIIDNIAAQGDVIKSAKNIYGKQMPVYISPLTLKKRFNPYATQVESRIKSGEERTDSRQKTVFCALFALGSIKNLTMAGADSITIFQTLGNQGIVSADHQPFPVYDALALILSGTARRIVGVKSSHPAIIDGLLFEDNVLLLWNYTPKEVDVQLPGGSVLSVPAYAILTSRL